MMRWVCPMVLALVAGLAARGDDWPQWMGPSRDGVWKEKGIVEKFPEGGPKRLWAEKIHGGYAGPAVADGRVYVMDYQTPADVRKLSDIKVRPKITGRERVVCLDARTGKEIWKFSYEAAYSIQYPAGPRCTPTVHGGKVFTLGAMGDLHCLDAKKGTKLWHVNFMKDHGAPLPVWGFCSHPLIDGQTVVCQVGGKGQAAIAWDKDKGTVVWKAAVDSKDAGYAPVTVTTAGGRKQLLIWHPEAIASVNPADGKPYWTVELEPSFGMSIMAPQRSGDYLFAGGIGGKSVLLALDKAEPGVKELWRGNMKTLGLSPVNSTPLMEKDTMFGVDQPGLLTAVDLKTGKRLWSDSKPVVGPKPASSGTAFLVKNGERYFLFNEKGELIIARMTRDKYEEIGRASLIKPVGHAFGRDVVWSHPAFAERCVFVRNDKEIVCYSLAK